MTDLTVHIPTLKHDPLVLRAPNSSDIGSVTRMLHLQPSRYFGEQLTLERASGIVNECVSKWITQGLGFWAIIKKNKTIGMVGFSDAYEEPELDITIDLNAENQGYGTQACRMVLECLFDTRPDTKYVQYCVDDGNDRAHALAKRLGGQKLTLEADQFGGTTTDTWYRIEAVA